MRYTDYQLYEYDGTLYLFYRDEPTAGTDSRWCLSTTSASTPTSGWATQTIVFREASTRSYVISWIDAANGRLHFATTNGASTGYTKLGHFYLDLDAGTYHKSDGTGITLPLAFSDVTEVYSGTADVHTWNVAVGSDGNPVISARDTTGSGFRHIWNRWNGSSWDNADVASGDDGYVYGDGGAQSYGACVDDLDPDVLWVIEEVSGQPEVAYYRTRDGGTSFERRTVTSGSSGLKLQLIPVRTPHRSLRVFWHEGTWTHYTDWSTGLSGAGF